MNNALCIYHSQCLDGWASAVTLRGAIPNAEFYPGVYGSDIPDVTNKNVYLVDFSYKRNIIEQMLEHAASVTIIDHHKTAIEDLQGLVHPRLVKVFNNERSGAALTWKFFYPSNPIHALILAIEDRDLWKFQYPITNEICTALYSYEFEFDIWSKFFETNIDTDIIADLIKEGKALLRSRNKTIKQVLANDPEMVIIGNYLVPVLNCSPTIKSEVGHELAKLGYKFGATYHDMNGKRVFSLRACDDFDVSEVAKQYGGGGHKAAAGFSIPILPMGEVRC